VSLEQPTPSPAVKPIDYSALTEPITSAQVADFRRQAKASGLVSGSANVISIASIVLLSVFGLFFVLFAGGALITFAVNSITFGLQGGSAFGLVIPLLVVVGFAFVVVTQVRRVTGAGGPWRRMYRLSGFAAANGLGYLPKSGDPGFGGMIFGQGDNRGCSDRVFRNGGRRIDIANYSWTTGSGRDRTTHAWGYLALQLDRRLPNMVLDAKSNNTLFGSDLPISFARDQKLSLEGDFDRYFTLYCPKEYERDALYVFTPDLMALLIDNSAQFDVEIVDDWMFLYSNTPLNIVDAATMNHLFRIVDTVGTKTLGQTERYSDDRVGSAGANMVAPQGRRLRHGVPIAGIVVIVAFAAFWLWSVFAH
jgi:hypothetical protein